jgi:galactokinase/mevalonate kinase-like predicted kinase
MSLFTTCIITVSTELRAQEYRTLIERRKNHGLYPSEIDFKVFSDPEKGNVGSGGAVLLALRQILDEKTALRSESRASIATGRVLILNAGGSGDALTTFSSEGILFAPVPVDSSSTIPPVMLDLQLDFFLKYPWNENEIVIAPADVYVDCASEFLAVKRGDLHGFAFPASFNTGSSHGVFRFDSYMHAVTGYFQKKDPVFLKKHALIEGTDTCAVDTGILSLSPSFVAALIKLSDTQFNETTLIDRLRSGKVSFDLYRELTTAALGKEMWGSDDDSASLNTLQRDLFLMIYDNVKTFTLTASLLRSVQFYHVDNLGSYFDLCSGLQRKQISLWYTAQFAELRVTHLSGWITFNCSHIQMPLRKGSVSLVEGASSCTIENALGGNLFSGMRNWQADTSIPAGMCIDCRTVDEKEVFLVYNTSDHFALSGTIDTLTFGGVLLEKWLTQRYLTLTDIGIDQETFRLGEAKLFRADVSDDFLSGYWNPPTGTQWKEKFCSSQRYSLSQCSVPEIALVRDKKRQSLRASMLHSLIVSGRGWVSAGANDFKEAFSKDINNTAIDRMYEGTSDILTRKYRGRLVDVLRGTSSHSSSVGFYQTGTASGLPASTYAINPDQTIVVRCPVRVDLAGGWSDIPPFTLKYGGAVVNMAVNLKGIEPVSVFLRRIEKPLISVHSIDRGLNYTCSDFDHFESAPPGFDLILNALRYCGFNNRGNSSLDKMLTKAGGGIEITTVCTVPQGSGLGGASIVTASVIASVYTLFGRSASWEQLLNDTIQVEQQSGAGSGWQDILGGIYGGIKLLQSAPGYFPQIKISRLNTDFLTDPFRQSCFTLVNTRLKRTSQKVGTLVADLMNESIPSYDYSIKKLKDLAFDAAEAVSSFDIHSLASVLNSYQDTNAKIHPFLANRQMDLLFEGLKDHYTGVKVTGAGGSGFALFISDTPEQAERLRYTIKNESDADLVDFALNTNGISVTIL